MKKLLLLVNDAHFFLTHRLPIAQAAKEQGFEVHVATTPASFADKISSHGLVFHHIPFARSGMHPLHELKTVFAIYRLYKSVKPTIVHQVSMKPVLYGGIVARFLPIPAMVSAVTGMGYLFVAKNLRARIVKRLVTAVYPLALRHKNLSVIVQNPTDGQWLTQSGIADPDVIRLILGSGVDLNTYLPKDEPAGKLVVLFASRLLRDKGVGEFVEAARILKTEGVQARFVLVGDVDLSNPTRVSDETLEQWRREEYVELWGFRQDMPDVIAGCHIFCLPSYREGLPKALIEVAACGRPIVTTDVPGCRDVVENGVNGLVVPARNAGALAEAIRKLVNDPEARIKMGQAGRKKAEKLFGLEGVVKATLGIYSELLNKIK